MELIKFFALIGMVADSFMAIFSVVGSFILFLGSFSAAPMRKYGLIANWSIMGLGMGIFFQICMAITHTTPEKIGILFRMSSGLVNWLLILSLLLLIGRWWIRKVRHQLS